MDELCVLLMPPRGSVSLLGGATSSSIIRGYSETECLLEELDDGAFDDRVFLVKKLVTIFHIIVALLTVYFGTPNMFIILWFGFVYGTNPPLGTVII
jgi:hypothetical protein